MLWMRLIVVVLSMAGSMGGAYGLSIATGAGALELAARCAVMHAIRPGMHRAFVSVGGVTALDGVRCFSSAAFLTPDLPLLGHSVGSSGSFSIRSQCAHRVRSFSTEVKNAVAIGNPCIDTIFQYGFSDSFILSHFLNAMLDLKDDQAIEGIVYLPRDLPSSDPLAEFQYHFTVDIRCRTKQGRHFLVEMQNDFRDDYHLKSLIEHSRMLGQLDRHQGEKDLAKQDEKNKSRKFWKDIEGLYTIIITNKTVPLSRKKRLYRDESVMEPFLVNPYELRHVNQLDRHFGDIPNQIILFMVDNLRKSVHELSTPLERWAYIFKDPNLRSGVKRISEYKKIPEPDVVAGSEKAIRSFIDRLDARYLPPAVKDQYKRVLDYYNTTIVELEAAAAERGEKKGIEKGKAEGLAEGEKKGKAEGLAEGLVEGEKKGLLDAALKMAQSGRLSVEEVASTLGLSSEQLTTLRAQLAKVSELK